MQKDFVAKAPLFHRLSGDDGFRPKVQAMQNVVDVVLPFVFVRPGDGDDRGDGERVNHVEFLFQRTHIGARRNVKGEVIKDDRHLTVFPRIQKTAMHAYPIYDLVFDVPIFLGYPIKAVIRLVRHDQNLMSLLNPTLADGGDREGFRVIMRGEDEDFHPAIIP